MATYVFGQVAAGKAGQYVQNAISGTPADAALIAVPLSQSGTAEQAETLLTLAAVEADANFAEQTNASWGRKTLAGVTYAWDATNNRNEADATDPVWAGPTTSFNTTGLLICYIPDNNPTGGISADSAVIPLVHLDMVVTADGNQVTYVFNAEGFYQATRV